MAIINLGLIYRLKMVDKKFKFNIAGIDNELIKKTALTYIGVIFLGVVVALFVVPRIADLNLLRKNVDRESVKLGQVRESISVLDQFDIRVGESNVKLVETALPAGFDPGLILSELRSASNKHGVVITSYSLSGGEINSGESSEEVPGKVGLEGGANNSQGVRLVEFDLVVSGPASNLISFMEGLEKTLPLTNVSEVEASEVTGVVKGSEGRNDVDLSLKLNYYYFPYQSVFGDDVITLDKYLIESDDLLLLTKLNSYSKPVKKQSGGISGGGNNNLFAVD